MRTIDDAVKDWHLAWDSSPATWAWCCHHKVLLEPLSEPAINRLNYILKEKSQDEQIIRIDNFRPLVSVLPEALVKARKEADKARKEADKAWWEYDTAWWEYEKAWREYDKARQEYGNVLQTHAVEIDRLHLIDVPNHTWNGKSIFKERTQ
jgi:hypothetical protein